LELLAKIPDNLMNLNPEIAVIGLVSLLILFGMPLFKSRFKQAWVQKLPAPLLVILTAVPMGFYFDLEHTHTYTFPINHARYEVGPNFLVNVPMNVVNAVSFPDFTALGSGAAWKWVAMFALIGALESMLSAKAVDSIDPWRRKTNLDRDNLAVGLGN